MGEQLDVLEGAGDPERSHLVGSHAQDALALPADVSLLGPVDLVEAVEDRGLPCAVGSDDGEQFVLTDLEGHAVDGVDTLEGEVDVVHLEQAGSHESHLLRRL